MAGSPRRRADGAVVSALVCTPFFLALIFLAIPARGMKWLAGAMGGRKQP